MKKSSLAGGPSAGIQRMRKGRIVRILFGPLPLRRTRRNRWRIVRGFIRNHELLAELVKFGEGTYDVNVHSLDALRQTLKASEPWLVVSPRDEVITWFGERIPYSSFPEHQLDYFELAEMPGSLSPVTTSPKVRIDRLRDL